MRIRDLTLTPELLSKVAELDYFRGSWDARATQFSPHFQAWKEEAMGQAACAALALSGVTLSDEDVKQLIPPRGAKAAQLIDLDEAEALATGYMEVLDVMYLAWERIVFSEKHIGELHALMYKFSSETDDVPGRYRTAGGTFEIPGLMRKGADPAAPDVIAPLMGKLVDWTNETLANRKLHPVLLAGMFCGVFLALHPFNRGNLPLAFLLTQFLLLRSGYGYVPYVSFEKACGEHKEDFYEALGRTIPSLASDRPDWGPWLTFFLDALFAQKEAMAERCGDKQHLYAEMPALAENIIELVRQNKRVSTGEIIKSTGEPRSTIKKRLAELVKQGLLERHGGGRSTWYTAA